MKLSVSSGICMSETPGDSYIINNKQTSMGIARCNIHRHILEFASPRRGEVCGKVSEAKVCLASHEYIFRSSAAAADINSDGKGCPRLSRMGFPPQ